MRAHGANGQLERLRNLLITAFLLMIKHQYGSLHRAELLQLLLYRILKLLFSKLLLGIGAGMREPILPLRFLLRKRDQGTVVTAPRWPLVPRGGADQRAR